MLQTNDIWYLIKIIKLLIWNRNYIVKKLISVIILFSNQCTMFYYNNLQEKNGQDLVFWFHRTVLLCDQLGRHDLIYVLFPQSLDYSDW